MIKINTFCILFMRLANHSTAVSSFLHIIFACIILRRHFEVFSMFQSVFVTFYLAFSRFSVIKKKINLLCPLIRSDDSISILVKRRKMKKRKTERSSRRRNGSAPFLLWWDIWSLSSPTIMYLMWSLVCLHFRIQSPSSIEFRKFNKKEIEFNSTWLWLNYTLLVAIFCLHRIECRSSSMFVIVNGKMLFYINFSL